MEGGVAIIQLVEQSNIVVYVASGRDNSLPRNKLIIWDEAAGQVVAELVVAGKIMDIKLRRDFLVIQCERQVILYKLETLEKVTTIDQFNN